MAPLARRSSGRSASPASTSSATRHVRARRRSGWPARSTSGSKKARAAELLALAADARAAWARGRVGGDADVLFESRLADGRWVGHATDHTLVAVDASSDRALENVIGRVQVERLDPVAPDRVVGRLVDVVPPPAPFAAGGIDGR